MKQNQNPFAKDRSQARKPMDELWRHGFCGAVGPGFLWYPRLHSHHFPDWWPPKPTEPRVFHCALSLTCGDQSCTETGDSPWDLPWESRADFCTSFTSHEEDAFSWMANEFLDLLFHNESHQNSTPHCAVKLLALVRSVSWSKAPG